MDFTARKLNRSDIADELGVVSAHIWRLLNKGYLSPTLQQAMVEAGWLEVSKRSPRISIQRDDPEAAAQSIINLMGKEKALALARRIYRHYLPILDNIFIVPNEGCKPVSFTDMVLVSETEDEDGLWVELDQKDG